MALQLTTAAGLGIAAGALIILVGAFMLAARPGSWLHRLFFALAVADGGGTILFRLRDASTTPQEAYLYMSGYWDLEILFVALLAAFLLVFPRTPARPARAAAGIGALLLGAAALVALFQIAPAWSWTGSRSPTGATTFAYAPLGDAVYTAFVLATGAVVLRLAVSHFRDPSPSHRRQGAFLLAGMLLANAPYDTTIVVNVILRDLPRHLLAGRPDIILAVWARLLVFVAIGATALAFLLDAHAERRQEKRIVLAAFAGLALLTALGGLDGALVTLCRMVGLVTYPILLGYAIARYEVFDIDAKLRRGATMALALAGLSIVFVVGESFAQNVLQSVLAGGVSAWVANVLSALATAVLSIPIVRLSRKVGARVLPDLTKDDLHQRKLDVYRHSVEGALADGIVVEREGRMLAALRESLGLSLEEHDAIVASVRQGAPEPPPSAPSAS